MTEPALPLGFEQLAISAALVLVAGLVSLALRLGLEGRLALASLRTVVQLLMVGYVLAWVFDLDRPLPVLAVMVVMIAAASRAAVRRSSRDYLGAGAHAFVTLVLTGSLTTFTVTAAVIRVAPWYEPRYVLPLLGMVLGNSLTGVSLALDSLLESLDEGAASIETDLALGATRWEAARGPLSEAVRRGMIPILNSMSVVGIVSLPGMMTGQILAGADPVDAVKYQIVVMFMIAAATSAGCMAVASMVFRSLFNDRHQLQRDRIRRR